MRKLPLLPLLVYFQGNFWVKGITVISPCEIKSVLELSITNWHWNKGDLGQRDQSSPHSLQSFWSRTPHLLPWPGSRLSASQTKISITEGAAVAPEDRGEANPFSTCYSNCTKSWPAGQSTAVWCNLAFQGKDTSLIKVCACNRGLNSAQFSSSLDQQQQHELLMCARTSPLAGTGLRFTASPSGSANTILSDIVLKIMDASCSLKNIQQHVSPVSLLSHWLFLLMEFLHGFVDRHAELLKAF